MSVDRTHRVRPGGFTLIELLVVVSIIALLISILLPSLKNAREQAKTVVCMATQRGITSSNAIYHSQYNDWLVGSPGTSGSALLGHPDRSKWEAEDTQLEVSASYLAVKLLQTWDWVTPLEMTDSVPTDRRDYFKEIFTRYRCAKNQFVARPVTGFNPASADWPTVQAPSYYTVRTMLLWASNASAPFGGASASSIGEGDIEVNQNVGWSLPRGYSPRLARVGNPSEKVFITDASRWTEELTSAVTYNIDWDASAGGTFATGGAALAEQWLRDFDLSSVPATRSAAKVTYRHRKSEKLGVAVSFFDGHSAYLSEAESRHPDFWWPKGTFVARAPDLQLNDPARKFVKKLPAPEHPTHYKVR